VFISIGVLAAYVVFINTVFYWAIELVLGRFLLSAFLKMTMQTSANLNAVEFEFCTFHCSSGYVGLCSHFFVMPVGSALLIEYTVAFFILDFKILFQHVLHAS